MNNKQQLKLNLTVRSWSRVALAQLPMQDLDLLPEGRSLAPAASRENVEAAKMS